MFRLFISPARSFFVFVVALIPIVLVGCSDTAVVLAFQFNRKIPGDLDAICLQVASGGREQFARHVDVTRLRNTTPTLTVEPGDGGAASFDLLLRGEVSRRRVTESRYALRFQTGAVDRVPIVIDPCGTLRGGHFTEGGLLSKEPGAVVAAMPSVLVRGDLALTIASAGGHRLGTLDRAGESLHVYDLNGGLPSAISSRALGTLTLNVMGDHAARDCDLDVLVLTEARPELWTQAEGLFTRSDSIPLSGAWSSAAAGDLKVGGGVDIALGGPTGLALLLDETSTEGGYQVDRSLLPTHPPVSALAVGHLDDDPYLDIVVGTVSGEDVVLQNDSRGQAHYTRVSVPGLTDAPKATRALAVADLDGDGRADILRATATGVELLRGVGAMRFSVGEPLAPSSVDSSEVSQILVRDLNNDCQPDIVLVRAGGSIVLYNAGALLFVVASVEPSGLKMPGTVAAAADLDGDGILDLVFGGETRRAGVGAYWVRQLP